MDRCFEYAADIGFIMDSSKSVNAEDFMEQKEFIVGLIKHFQISVDEVQVGIVKYGRDAGVEINFGEFPTEEDLIRNINAIEHERANESRLDLALKLAKEKLFLRSRAKSAEKVSF